MTPYVELSARSAFSFLEAASAPERLVDEAARLELPALALVDVDGVYGAPRFHKAAQAAGVRPLVGTALTLADGTRLSLLVESRAGYRALGRLVTRVKARGPKGRTRATWDDLDGAGRGARLPHRRAGRPADPGPPRRAPGGGAGDPRPARRRRRSGPALRGAPAARHARERARDRAGPWRSRGTPGSPSSPRAGCSHATPGERPVLDVLTAVRLRTPARRARPAPAAERRAPPAPAGRDGPPLRRPARGRGRDRRDRRPLRVHARGPRLSLPRLPGARRPAPDRLPARARRRPAPAGGIAP